jgi:hypothetical protein
MHTGTECMVHVEVTGSSDSCAFDFRYALDFVVVAHLRLARFTCLLDFRDARERVARSPQQRRFRLLERQAVSLSAQFSSLARVWA